LVLNDLKCAETGALDTTGTQEKASVPRRSKKNRARSGEVRAGIEIFGDADGILEHHRINIVIGIEVDATHKLDELTRLSPVVAAFLVEVLANQVKGHF
jgi:hypothetical protein